MNSGTKTYEPYLRESTTQGSVFYKAVVAWLVVLVVVAVCALAVLLRTFTGATFPISMIGLDANGQPIRTCFVFQNLNNKLIFQESMSDKIVWRLASSAGTCSSISSCGKLVCQIWALDDVSSILLVPQREKGRGCSYTAF